MQLVRSDPIFFFSTKVFDQKNNNEFNDVTTQAIHA